jgi:predicted PurR-regulated permease PerM/ActR/RegA family two-component response regulator
LILSGLLLLLCASALWLLYALRSVVLLVILSIFFAYVVAPLVEMVEHWLRAQLGVRRVAPRTLAIFIVYALIAGTVVTAGFLLVPSISTELTQLTADAPAFLARSSQEIEDFTRSMRRMRLPPAFYTTIDNATTVIADKASQWAVLSFESLPVLFKFAPWFVLIPIISLFMLKDAESFRRLAIEALPPGRTRWRGSDFFDDVNRTLASYVRAQLVGCAFVGIVCLVAFELLDVPYAFVLGALAMILELLPVVGPVSIAVVAVVSAGFVSSERAFMTLGFLVALRLFYDYVIFPKLISRGVKLHPLMIFLGIIAGAELGGIPGVFLAIPVIAVLSVSYRYLRLHFNQGLLQQFLGIQHEEEEGVAPVLPSQLPSRLPLAGIHVLVVDDDDDAREVIAATLASSGCEVSVATSSKEALALSRLRQLDVIVSDLEMPIEDGFHLMRELRLREAGGPPTGPMIPPVVALSGHGTEEDRARSIAAGFQRHLTKPVDPVELARVIVELAREPRKTA